MQFRGTAKTGAARAARAGASPAPTIDAGVRCLSQHDRAYLEGTSDIKAEMKGILSATKNDAAVNGAMCRTMLSVAWDGSLYDCDFNQMLEMGPGPRLPKTILDAKLEDLVNRVIQIGQHCFGCTAGLGSS